MLRSEGIAYAAVRADTKTQTGRATADRLAILPDFEEEVLRERTRTELAHAWEYGKRQPRPYAPLKFGNYIASSSKSEIGVWRSAERWSAGFWPDLYFQVEIASRAFTQASRKFTVHSQLGLKLEARRAPVEFIVIDRAERTPVAN